MQGTQKQIEWATTIKAEFDATFTALKARATKPATIAAVEKLEAAYSTVIEADSAASWIDLRDYLDKNSIAGEIREILMSSEYTPRITRAAHRSA